MNKADELRKMVKDYWESEEIKEKVQTCVDDILKHCEERAKLGKTSYTAGHSYSNLEYWNKVIDALRKEDLSIISLEHISYGEWLISW